MYDIMNYQIIQKSEEAYVMSMMDVQLNCQDKVSISETLQDMANEQAAFGTDGKIKDTKVTSGGDAKISKALIIGILPIVLAVIACIYFYVISR